MIPMDLLKLIDKYNEKGIFIQKIDKLQWFNGKRYEVFPLLKHLPTYGRLIQMQINDTLHSYVFSSTKILHFNGTKWQTVVIDHLPDDSSNDCGKYFYLLSYLSGNKYNLIHKKTSIYCVLFLRAFTFFKIDFDGKLYRMKFNFSVHNLQFNDYICEHFEIPICTNLM